jgi:hypothetical protein
MEDAGQRAIDFIHGLYDKGYADFTQEPVEIL